MTHHATHDSRTLLPLTAISTDFPHLGSSTLYPPKRLDPPHPSPILTEPPTPDSTLTIRRTNTSLAPNDDDGLPMPIDQNARTRSPSRIYRWIEDQQHLATAVEHIHLAAPAPGVPAGHPYLAYPQMSTASLMKTPKDVAHVEGYVFVGGHAVSHPTERVPQGDAHVTQSQPPSGSPESPGTAPTSTPRKSRNSQGIFHTPSTLRNLHLSFTARKSPVPSPSAAHRAHSPASSTSTFRRSNAQLERTASHSRGSSLSTVSAIQRGAQPVVPELTVTPPKTTAWKFKRPSVAGHFTPSSLDDESESGSPPPRPSTSTTSSSVTHSGSSTTYTRTSSDAPRKMYFGSIRSHSSTTIFSSSPSLWSLPADATHINDPPESTKVIARDRIVSAPEGEGNPMTWKPATPTNLGGVTSLLTSPKARRKRKLIISGIPPHDERRFDAVKKWCESFGELNSITRVQNGDLHVDFRKVEVADTVCRLNARVQIAGVGSVCLSWFTGKRP